MRARTIRSSVLVRFERREMGRYDFPSPLSFSGLRMGMISAVFQVCGITLLLMTFVYSLARCFIACFPRCFRCLLVILSGPEDFLLGAFLIAVLTSVSVIVMSSFIMFLIFLCVFLLCLVVFLTAIPVYCLLKQLAICWFVTATLLLNLILLLSAVVCCFP